MYLSLCSLRRLGLEFKSHALAAPRDLTQGYKRSKSENMGIVLTEMELILEQTQQVTHWFTLIVLSALRRSDNENMLSLMNLMQMSILTDSKITKDGVLPSRSDEVLKLKNFKKDATLKLFKSTNQERYEHVGPEVISSQDDEVTRWRNEIMLG
ncbi:hypothetical protein Tco_0493160 [Tanacetum coccineum]